MPRIKYKNIKLQAAALAVVEHGNSIIATYVAQGYDLTLRQLWYQFVGRGLLDLLGFKVDASGSTNNTGNYKRLASIVNDARLAGLIDWDHITDRTRNLHQLGHWDGPNEIVAAVAEQFRGHKWADQPYRVEIWSEKEALAGVFERVGDELDVPCFACRGYVSQSEMWSAAMRLKRYKQQGQTPIILHFGDHDPSGIDMTRDIVDRLQMFMGGLAVRRLALNMSQIEEFSPPPNPAKITDSRSGSYIAEYGNESWELDALDPTTLAGLVRDAIMDLRDEDLWAEAVERENEAKRLLQVVADGWDHITSNL